MPIGTIFSHNLSLQAAKKLAVYVAASHSFKSDGSCFWCLHSWTNVLTNLMNELHELQPNVELRIVIGRHTPAVTWVAP